MWRLCSLVVHLLPLGSVCLLMCLLGVPETSLGEMNIRDCAAAKDVSVKIHHSGWLPGCCMIQLCRHHMVRAIHGFDPRHSYHPNAKQVPKQVADRAGLHLGVQLAWVDASDPRVLA